MNRAFSLLLLISYLQLSSCIGQPGDNALANISNAQVADFVVASFEDSEDNLWFGTMNFGAARYNGQELRYFTTADGLPGNTVTEMALDDQNNLWLATHSGLSKYDGNAFTNFIVGTNPAQNRVSQILIDRNRTMWIGTWDGVYIFDGVRFTRFPVPNPDVELLPFQTTMDWVTEILEDMKGNIWISRDGYGVCKYDGTSFAHLTQKDGLPSNNVQAVAEDNDGNIWFGCRIAERDNPDASGRNGDGGLAMYDGNTVIQFPELRGLYKSDVYTIYKDRSGSLWISTTGAGAYRHAHNEFTLFSAAEHKEGSGNGAVIPIQSILEDKAGNIWFGASGGLYRLQDTLLVNVRQDGPWE